MMEPPANEGISRVCNLYSVTTNVEAIRALVRAFGPIGAVIGGAVIMGALGVLLVHSGLPPGPVTVLKAALVLVVAGVRARAGAKA